MQGVGLKGIRDRRLKNVQCPVDQLALRLALEPHLLGPTLLGAEKGSYSAITFRGIVGEAVGGLERGPPTGVCVNTSGDGLVHFNSAIGDSKGAGICTTRVKCVY